MSDTIRRVDVLREMEIKEDGLGKQVVFSVEFWTKSGEVVFMPRARMCGVKAGVDMKKARVRNLQRLNQYGAVEETVMVSIDLLRSFNGKRVTL
mgnify:CR=1 FL=1